MAKHQLTYNQLFAIDQDLNRLRLNSPALMLLLHKDINNYLRHAEMELKVLYKNMQEIQCKYIEQNEDGSLKTKENGDFEFKRTVTSIKAARILTGDDVEQAYMDEVNEFLNRSCTIDL